MAPSPEQLGDYVARRRNELGCSLRQLAAKTHSDHTTILAIERGRVKSPNPLLLQRLARALDVDYEDLAALTGNLPPSGLPTYATYLRTKYPDLPDEEVERMEHDFAIRLEHYERQREEDAS